jgi:endonuclease/exonuclease/phosphatase family metal-dependent hydrolase
MSSHGPAFRRPLLLRMAAISCLAIFSTCIHSAEPIRIQTYNIRYLNENDGKDVWANRSAAVIKTIRGAELVGLQEVVAQQLSDISAATPDMEWYGRGRDDGQLKGEMTPIGWRKDLFEALDQGTFWLSEKPEEIGQKSWDAALPRIASWVRLSRKSDRKELLLVNTHFDHVGKEARHNSAKLVLRWIVEHRNGLPVVLIGDLNADRDASPLLELLGPANKSEIEPVGDASRYLVDALVTSKAMPTGPTGTWNGFKAIAEGSRIDHVLVAAELNVLSYSTLDPRTEQGRFASDHLPIQIEIEL